MIETLAGGVKFESFEEAEAPTSPDESEQALALCNKLGLTKQCAMLKRTERPMRFRRMTKDEFAVYRALCPEETLLQQYDLSPVPLRVLQIAELAGECGLHRLTVWHPEVVTTDPVLVGFQDPRTYYDREIFILARWGAALDEWPALVKAAREVVVNRLRGVLAMVQGDLARAEAEGVSACRPVAVNTLVKGQAYTKICE